MTAENIQANAGEELARALESLRASAVLLREGLFNDSISDSYYAAFHAVRALLFTVGEEPRTHRGTLHLFNVHFVRTGKIDARHLSALAQAQYDRASADYGASRRFSQAEAEAEHTLARELVEAVRQFLMKEGVAS